MTTPQPTTLSKLGPAYGLNSLPGIGEGGGSDKNEATITTGKQKRIMRLGAKTRTKKKAKV